MRKCQNVVKFQKVMKVVQLAMKSEDNKTEMPLIDRHVSFGNQIPK